MTASERSSVRALSTSTAVNPAMRARTASRASAQILCLHREQPLRDVAGSRARAPPGAAQSGARESSAAIMAVVDQVRIDKWLWAARFFKTRGAATEAVLGGRVHINGERVKPSKVVRTGDTVEVTIGTARRTVAVTDVAERRGPASVAATMYAETPESHAAREQHALERRLARPLGADLRARPTKQARRRLDALRRARRRGR
jgi:ribosome-associated heat shock protein Hsp15